MGSDPAPFMANLFSYYCENKCLLDIKKRNLRTARLFSNTFSFIDDLCAMNNYSRISQELQDYISFRVTTGKGKHFKFQSIIFRPSLSQLFV